MSAPDSADADELNRFRTVFNQWHDDALDRAGKEPNLVDAEIKHLYADFGPRSRRFCDSVLSEWLSSPDVSRRFTAFSLIRKFRIKSAVPALQEFIRTHSSPKDAPERLGLEKAKRVLEHCMTESADLMKEEQAGD